jgi:hypothetical protein
VGLAKGAKCLFFQLHPKKCTDNDIAKLLFMGCIMSLSEIGQKIRDARKSGKLTQISLGALWA